MKSFHKGLFIGSLLPTKRNPEAGIFYYKLIYFLSKKISNCYLIYPKKLNLITNEELTLELRNIGNFIDRPFFISFGPLSFLKFLYKYINYLSFLTFNLAIKRSYKKLVLEGFSKPSFIYSHFIFPSGLSAAFISKEENIPCITAVGESSLEYLNQLPQKYLSRYLKKIDTFISVNKKNAKILNEKFNVDKSKIYIIPNTADSEIFYKKNYLDCRKKLNLEFEQKYILFVGSFTIRKGIDVLLKTAYKNPSYKFLLIGKDIENMGAKIKKLENVFNLGVQTQKTISNYMNASDLFVLFSRNEGSPNVLMEANATNLPILCSDIQEHKDIFGDNEVFYSSAIRSNISDDLNSIFKSEKYKRLKLSSYKSNLGSFEKRSEKILNLIINKLN